MSKLRTILCLISLQLPLFNMATVQIPDQLILEGEKYDLNTYILEAYFKNNPEKRPVSNTISVTSLHRGYIANYEFIDDVCYLTAVLIPTIDTTIQKRSEVLYENVIHELFDSDKYVVPVDWYEGLLYMTSKYGSANDLTAIIKHTIVELKNSKLGKVKHFSNAQLASFRQSQFLRFKQTDEYVKIKQDLRYKSFDEAKIEKIVATNIFSYLKSILVNDNDSKMTTNLSNKLEDDTVIVQLEYYGWGCPCPQWISKENKLIYESKEGVSKEEGVNLFWYIKPANDSLPDPFELTDDMNRLTLEFKGRFFVEPQFLGVEGEQGPARTLLYYSVRPLKE